MGMILVDIRTEVLYRNDVAFILRSLQVRNNLKWKGHMTWGQLNGKGQGCVKVNLCLSSGILSEWQIHCIYYKWYLVEYYNRMSKLHKEY